MGRNTDHPRSTGRRYWRYEFRQAHRPLAAYLPPLRLDPGPTDLLGAGFRPHPLARLAALPGVRVDDEQHSQRGRDRRLRRAARRRRPHPRRRAARDGTDQHGRDGRGLRDRPPQRPDRPRRLRLSQPGYRAGVTQALRDLENTVALVTGASSGIGQAAARTLAARGAAVALAARRADRLQELAGEIADAGGTALPIEADVSDREQAQTAVAKTAEELGRLDVLVNNAGVMLLGPVAEAPLEEWERMIHVNLL